MVFSLDFLGFGSKRKTAFRVLDREWTAMDIDIRRVDDGVRHLLYQWSRERGDLHGNTDFHLVDLAMFSGFLMLGPELAARPLGKDGLSAMESRLEQALSTAENLGGPGEPVDIRVTKLILASKLADRDIEAIVALEQDDE